MDGGLTLNYLFDVHRTHRNKKSNETKNSEVFSALSRTQMINSLFVQQRTVYCTTPRALYSPSFTSTDVRAGVTGGHSS